MMRSIWTPLVPGESPTPPRQATLASDTKEDVEILVNIINEVRLGVLAKAAGRILSKEAVLLLI